ncbi:hypothetical protein EG328_000189 [Venturia inaequalis]|uniref:Uncharacterized protein n=1 Tax=Venturia inaequalis TaxID=5025 RepID=A0A8H3V5B3_VENIN|nr:hypothetical protein EG327_009592 [Venturia inaequalis]KAE9980644.1 hypothetical protein EG328_000189 [Venturia inaequalis]RDI83388.1 hypothetical protein Vi05172_g6506 [Venturia inaequalis]
MARRHNWFGLWIWLLILGTVLAIDDAVDPLPRTGAARSTLLPDEDDFYKPPLGFEKQAVGSILRSRTTPNSITLNNIDAIRVKESWQLLYRTQNSVEEPTATVVTVIVPYRAKPNHLFSYSYFSDAAYNGCNPSVTLQIGAREDNVWNQVQNAILVQALAMGYYVSVADFEGTQAAFGSGLQAAYATLDSIRAVKQSGNLTGIDANPITTLHGYSSGAQAVGWTTEMHPVYAPELQIAGAAFGGLVPNISALFDQESYQKGERAFLSPPVILGLSHDYKNLSDYLTENLVPETAAAYRLGDQRCVDGNKNFTNTDMGKYYKKGYFASIHDPLFRSIASATGVQGLRSTPKIPWYIYHSAADDVSPQNLTDRIYDIHCKNGANILYEKNPLPLNHRSECVAGLAGAFRWIADRHEGRPIVPGCSTVNFTYESIRGTARGVLVQGLISNMWAYLGWEVGPDWNWWDDLKGILSNPTGAQITKGKTAFLSGERVDEKKTNSWWPSPRKVKQADGKVKIVSGVLER